MSIYIYIYMCCILYHIYVCIHTYYMGGSMRVPQNGWFIGESPIEMDDSGVRPCMETLICIQYIIVLQFLFIRHPHLQIGITRIINHQKLGPPRYVCWLITIMNTVLNNYTCDKPQNSPSEGAPTQISSGGAACASWRCFSF